MPKFYVIAFVLLYFSQFSNAEIGFNDVEPDELASYIKGRIVDVQSGETLEFATISVFKNDTDQLIGGSITDDKGDFEIALDVGIYDLKIEFLSYETIELPDVEVKKTPRVNNLGEIKMHIAEAFLDEIEVRAEKSEMKIDLDKRVFNVGKDLASRGGSVLNILDNVPSVTVDVEGNVALRGNQNVRVLIDGKPSGLVGMSGTEALRALPSNIVDRVEVITNPSARYEAAGTAGIINIILKKEERKGINGSVNASLGQPDAASLGFNLNYRKDKLNWFLNYSIGERDSRGGGLTDINYLNSSQNIAFTQNEGNRSRNSFFNSVKFGADYSISAKDELTLAAMFKYDKADNINTVTYKDFNAQSALIGDILRTELEQEREPVQEYNLVYEHKMRGKKHSFVFDALYTSFEEDENSDFINEEFDLISQEVINRTNERATIAEGENKWQFKADYLNDRVDDKFESGVLARFREVGNNYNVQNETEPGVWVDNDQFTNEFLYDENIVAAYGTYGKKWNAFSTQIGLRAEYTDLTTKLKSATNDDHQNYLDWFPSVNVAYAINEKKSIQASYSRRINRPGFFSLNPFITFADARNIFSGNPNLKPEYADQLDFGYVIKTNAGSILTSIYYKYEDQVITRVNERNGDIGFILKPENIGHKNSIGLEFTATHEVNKWWRVNGDVNLFYFNYEGQLNDVFYSDESYSMRGRISNKFKVSEFFDMQITANYRGPNSSPQNETKAVSFADFGITRDVLKGNGTLSFNVSDVLNSRRRYYTFTGQDFVREGNFQWRGRTATLEFVYRINQKKSSIRPQGARGPQ